MEQLNELEREFFKAMKGREYVDGRDGNSFSANEAKACAALCESKMREAWIALDIHKMKDITTDQAMRKAKAVNPYQKKQ